MSGVCREAHAGQRKKLTFTPSAKAPSAFLTAPGRSCLRLILPTKVSIWRRVNGSLRLRHARVGLTACRYSGCARCATFAVANESTALPAALSAWRSGLEHLGDQASCARLCGAGGAICRPPHDDLDTAIAARRGAALPSAQQRQPRRDETVSTPVNLGNEIEAVKLVERILQEQSPHHHQAATAMPTSSRPASPH